MTHKPDPSLYLLGKYLGLVFLLPSGAVAGYLVGAFLASHFHWPGFEPAGIIIGVAGGMVKLFEELLRDAKKSDSK